MASFYPYALSVRTVLSLLLLLGGLELGAAKSVSGTGPGEVEMRMRVLVLDSAIHWPVRSAVVDLTGNHSSSLASTVTGEDGIAMVTFLYQPGSRVIIKATRQGYVTNSAPWSASHPPVYAVLSLYLLGDRTASLLVYPDSVLLGAPGAKDQPWVRIKRSALSPSLPLNLSSPASSSSSSSSSSSPVIRASLTAARSLNELSLFPFPLAKETDRNNSNGWVELTAVAAVCVRLSVGNISLSVSQSVHVSVPLPVNTVLSQPTSVPLWRLQDTTGLWQREGTGYLRRDGEQLVWSFMAPQLGAWMAAFSTGDQAVHPGWFLSSLSSSPPSILLLSILLCLTLLLLLLLVLLLYHCRRRCIKPRNRRQRGKAMSGYHRNQSTSYHPPHPSTEPLLSSRDGPLHPATLPHKQLSSLGNDDGLAPCLLALSGGNQDNKGNTDGLASCLPALSGVYPQASSTTYSQAQVPRPPEYSASDTQTQTHCYPSSQTQSQPGQLVLCHSLDQMRETLYHSMVPTLVIPTHWLAAGTGLAGAAGAGAAENRVEAATGLGVGTRFETGFGAGGKAETGLEKASGAQKSTLQTDSGTKVGYWSKSSLDPTMSDLERALEEQQLLQHNSDGLQVSLTLPLSSTQGQPASQQSHRGGLRRGEGSRSTPSSSGASDGTGSRWPSERSGTALSSVQIPLLFNDQTVMAQVSGQLQALTNQTLLELGIRPDPQAWFVSLDGRPNSLVQDSYLDLRGEGGGERTHQDGEERRSAEVVIEGRGGGEREGRREEERRHLEGGGERKIHNHPPHIASPASSSSQGQTDGQADGQSDKQADRRSDSSSPEPDQNSLKRMGTFPRKGRGQGRQTDRETGQTNGGSDRQIGRQTRQIDRLSAYSREEEDEEGENRKSPWQKREERPLMIFK